MAQPTLEHDSLTRTTFPVGLLQCNCTILADHNDHTAVVIDPGDGSDVQRVLDYLAAHGLTLKQILVTHAHIDHVGGAAALRQATGAPVLMDQRDLPLLQRMDMQAGWLGMQPPAVVPPDHSPAAGEQVGTGGWQGSVIPTPGHTPGSLCIHFPERELLVAGDTLFAGSIGRTDLPGGDMKAILRSIHDRLLCLPEQTNVVPGHGNETQIGTEKQDNPFLINPYKR